MTKKKKAYICTECGYRSSQWIGKCNSCLSWNSLEEESIQKETSASRSISKIQEVKEKPLGYDRNIYKEILGDVSVGALILTSGEPGVGKSTFVLNLISTIKNQKVLYISSEESHTQVFKRCKRMEILDSDISFTFASSWNQIKREIPLFDVIIIDSIQALQHEDFLGQAGSTGVVKEIVSEILDLAKSRGITFFIISQVNKAGAIAGPKALEHMVDISISLTFSSGFIRVETNKNRFGTIGKTISFSHDQKGIKFINEHSCWSEGLSSTELIGCVCSVINTSHEVSLVEVECLVRGSSSPKNIAYNYEFSRMNILLAILESSFPGILKNKELYLNLITKSKTIPNKLDLAVIASILGRAKGKKIQQNFIFLGELSLTGRVLKFPEDKQIESMLENSFVEKIVCNTKIKNSKIHNVRRIEDLFTLFG